jgi:MYXO-CTERM domain-containing protein
MVFLAMAYAADEVCSNWNPSELRSSVKDLPTTESSGLAWWGDTLLTHPDSSGNAELYAFDTTGEFLRTIPVSGATNTDWEDLAVGACDEGTCAWIADIGDNDGVRDEVTIWRAPLSDAVMIGATACPLRYDDGEAHDAEALLLFPDQRVRVVTKTSGKATVFRSEPLRCDGEAQTLYAEVKLDLSEPVTGGTVSADGTLVVLRGLTVGWAWQGCVLDWSAEPTGLLFVGEDQGEGVALAADGTLWTCSEGEDFDLHELPCTETAPPPCEGCACAAATAPGSAAAAFVVAALAALRRRTRIWPQP